MYKYYFTGLLSGDGWRVRVMDAEYKKLFPISMQYLWTSKLKYQDEMSEKIRKHFFGNKHINGSTVLQIIDVSTNIINFVPIFLTCP